MRFAMLVAAFSAACLAVPAQAADFSVNVTATNFKETYIPSLNVPLPVSPVNFTGLFTLDITGNVNATTAGLTVQSFNLPYGVQYAYNRSQDTLIIGTYINGFSIPSTPSSWFVAIGNAFYGSPFAYNFVQMVDQADPNKPFTYSTQDVAISIQRLDAPGNNGVPEPATWAMMLIGFGAIGASLRRRSIPALGVAIVK